jgi:hypothetical protein
MKIILVRPLARHESSLQTICSPPEMPLGRSHRPRTRVLEHFRLKYLHSIESADAGKTRQREHKEHTENRERRFSARADIGLSRFSPCPSVFLCELCVEFRDLEYSEKLSKTAAIERKHLSRKRSRLCLRSLPNGKAHADGQYHYSSLRHWISRCPADATPAK